MSATEMVMVITAIGGLAVILGGQAVLIINARKATEENTRVTLENTADREVKTAVTVATAADAKAVLDTMAGQVQALVAAPTKPATKPPVAKR